MQLAIVVIVTVLAAGYAAHRVYQALRHASDPCYGCSGCQLKQQRRRLKGKKETCEKKSPEKFG